MSGEESVGAARKFTYIFAGLMIVVASITAYFVIENPKSRIIPIVLGIFGYTYGSLLGIFLLGLLTKTRGSDRGNFIAMIFGFIVVALLSGLPNQFLELFGAAPLKFLADIPTVTFLWRIMFGSLATLSVAMLFPRENIKPPEELKLVPGNQQG
jgi:Na+/proline symporter